MSKSAESPQAVWQTTFQNYPNLNPFMNDGTGLGYNDLTSPATWWHNPLNHNSLRLTKKAYNMLNAAKIKDFKFRLPAKILPKTLLQLEKYFTAPYFIPNVNTIICYGETESIMLALHTNNLQQYLDNQEL
jgi:hypothetical protein